MVATKTSATLTEHHGLGIDQLVKIADEQSTWKHTTDKEFANRYGRHSDKSNHLLYR